MGPILRFFLLTAVLSFPGTAQEPPERAQAPATESAREALGPDFGGRWYSHFGYLDLEQTGNQVQGTYSCCEGRISGQVKGEMLEFLWQDPIYGDGWGHFYLREEGERLVGGWGGRDDMGVAGPWNAVRLEEPEVAGSTRRFRVETAHPRYGDLEAISLLHVSGDEVRGELRGTFHLSARGKPFRQEIYHLLTGRREGESLTLEWRDPIDGEGGEITLLPRGDHLEGRWQPGDGGEGEEITFFELDDGRRENAR